MGNLSEDDLEEVCKERGLYTEQTMEGLKNQVATWLTISRSNPDILLRLLIYHHGYQNVDMWLQPTSQHPALTSPR